MRVLVLGATFRVGAEELNFLQGFKEVGVQVEA